MCLPSQPWVLLCAKLPASPGTAGSWWGGEQGEAMSAALHPPLTRPNTPFPHCVNFVQFHKVRVLFPGGKMKKRKRNKNSN